MVTTYTGKIKIKNNRGIYVFGSNTEGRHGKGNAKVARDKYGALRGVSRGRMGQCYAICTKDLTKHAHPSVPESEIISQISTLYEYASTNPHLEFYIAYRAIYLSMLSGYWAHDFAKMFSAPGNPPSNIIFERNFRRLVDNEPYKLTGDTLHGFLEYTFDEPEIAPFLDLFAIK